MDDEGHMGGYTLNNEIYLSEFDTERFARAYQGDPSLDADYREYRVHLARELVSHELFHTLTRNDADFRRLMYSLAGITVMDHNVQFGPTVQGMLVSNPDVEKYDNYGEFTINGQKRRCILVAVYCGTFAEAVAAKPYEGATAGLDWDMYEKRVAQAEESVRGRAAAFRARMDALLPA